MHTYHPFTTDNLPKILYHSHPYVNQESIGVRVINVEKLDPGVGFGYVVRDEAEYETLMLTLKLMSEEDEDNAIF